MPLDSADMSVRGHREEVLNVVLAQLLNKRGVVSAPEQITAIRKGARRLPDVVVEFEGLRTIIEGKFDDAAEAEMTVLQQAMQRVEEGLAHIALAVTYPAGLRAVPFERLKTALAKSSLEVHSCSEAGSQGPITVDVDGLEALLRRTFEQLVEENVVARAVESLEIGINVFSLAVRRNEATVLRFADVLGIGEEASEEIDVDE